LGRLGFASDLTTHQALAPERVAQKPSQRRVARR